MFPLALLGEEGGGVGGGQDGAGRGGRDDEFDGREGRVLGGAGGDNGGGRCGRGGGGRRGGSAVVGVGQATDAAGVELEHDGLWSEGPNGRADEDGAFVTDVRRADHVDVLARLGVTEVGDGVVAQPSTLDSGSGHGLGGCLGNAAVGGRGGGKEP